MTSIYFGTLHAFNPMLFDFEGRLGSLVLEAAQVSILSAWGYCMLVLKVTSDNMSLSIETYQNCHFASSISIVQGLYPSISSSRLRWVFYRLL